MPKHKYISCLIFYIHDTTVSRAFSAGGTCVALIEDTFLIVLGG